MGHPRRGRRPRRARRDGRRPRGAAAPGAGAPGAPGLTRPRSGLLPLAGRTSPLVRDARSLVEGAEDAVGLVEPLTRVELVASVGLDAGRGLDGSRRSARAAAIATTAGSGANLLT